MSEILYRAFYIDESAPSHDDTYRCREFTADPDDDWSVVIGEAEMLPADHSWTLSHILPPVGAGREAFQAQ